MNLATASFVQLLVSSLFLTSIAVVQPTDAQSSTTTTTSSLPPATTTTTTTTMPSTTTNVTNATTPAPTLAPLPFETYLESWWLAPASCIFVFLVILFCFCFCRGFRACFENYCCEGCTCNPCDYVCCCHKCCDDHHLDHYDYGGGEGEAQSLQSRTFKNNEGDEKHNNTTNGNNNDDDHDAANEDKNFNKKKDSTQPKRTPNIAVSVYDHREYGTVADQLIGRIAAKELDNNNNNNNNAKKGATSGYSSTLSNRSGAQQRTRTEDVNYTIYEGGPNNSKKK